MTVPGDSSRRTSSHGQVALEDRFEVIKEIGDGSFGNVVLARVRTAGANVARRGTVVGSPCAPYRCSSNRGCPDRNQVNEEDVRLLLVVSRAEGSRLFAHASPTSASRACSRHIPGPIQQEATYLYGVYGRQLVSVDEGERSQVP
jgi:hypothetical protein